MQGLPCEITKQSRLGHFLEDAPQGTIYWNFETFGEQIDTKWNKGCYDVSKNKVNKVMLEAFGYSQQIDPMTYDGTFVEKSILQAKHDGKIYTTNIEPKEGKIYERFIDSITKDYYNEYRVFIFNEARFVMVKRKSKKDLFGWKAIQTTYYTAQEVFNEYDLHNINKFCNIFDVQLCELDILKDVNGKPYIIDVNNMAGGTDDFGIFRLCTNKDTEELKDIYRHHLKNLE